MSYYQYYTRKTQRIVIYTLVTFNLIMSGLLYGPVFVKNLQANQPEFEALYDVNGSDHTDLESPEGINIIDSLPKLDVRIEQIKANLKKKNSPMVGLEEHIVNVANAYGVDPLLIVAIAGQESSFGKYRCGYNAWGYASCKVRFSSWEDAVEKVVKLLASPPYSADEQATPHSIQLIGRIYAADPEWASKVQTIYSDLAQVVE